MAKKPRKTTPGNGKFSQQVKAFTARTKRRLEFTYLKSAQDTITYMQTPVGAGGNLPVDTGFLRNSLKVTLNTAASGAVFRPADYLNTGAPGHSAIINTARLQDSIFAVYLANYAVYQEYGANGRDGRRFVLAATFKWPEFVRQNAKLSESIK